jgi:hypothetical protein
MGNSQEPTTSKDVRLVGLTPFPPMGRVDVDAGSGFDFDPTTQNAGARKDKRVVGSMGGVD